VYGSGGCFSILFQNLTVRAEKPMKTSHSVASPPAEDRTRGIPNAKQDCKLLDQVRQSERNDTFSAFKERENITQTYVVSLISLCNYHSKLPYILKIFLLPESSIRLVCINSKPIEGWNWRFKV
jgi:hypothetical protein